MAYRKSNIKWAFFATAFRNKDLFAFRFFYVDKVISVYSYFFNFR